MDAGSSEQTATQLLTEGDKMYSVYKHTSPSGKIYIGVTSRRPKLRWHNGSGYADNEYFTRAINKYGWNNFSHEILMTNLSKEEAESKEIELIALYHSNEREYGYNIENGGSLCGKHSEYTKMKISNALKGKKNPRFGKKYHNQMYKSRGVMGKEEWLRRSLSHKGQVPVNKKQVRQLSLSGEEIRIFNSMLDASKETGIEVSNISRCANGERKSAGGFIWELK